MPGGIYTNGTNALASLLRLESFLFRVLWKELHSSTFKFTLKRLLIVLFLSAFLPMIMIWNHIGLYLDNILFPNWRNQEVVAPLFIVGNARSGTTWLHRLISHDTESFTTMKTWEIIFAVSITWKRLFQVLFVMDSSILCGAVFAFLNYIEKRTVSHVKIHPIGLQKVEEDEWLMVHIARSQLLTLFYPLGVDVIIDLVLFDYAAKLSKETRREIFGYYRECVQRHLYYYKHFCTKRGDGEVIFLSKNPAFTLRLESLYEVFPDARVICLLRNPVQSIPSMISYISMVWHVFSNPKMKYPQAAPLLGFCQAHYLYPLEVMKTKPESQWSFLSYHTLLVSLEDTVLQTLKRLYPPDNAGQSFAVNRHTFHCVSNEDNCDAHGNVDNYSLDLKKFLREEQLKSRNFVGFHEHSVDQCCDGMTEEELKINLQLVYEALSSKLQ